MAKGWNEKNLFRLARELRWVGYEPTPESMNRTGFRWACQQFDKNFEETVRTLRAMWEKVRTTPQDHSLIRAMAFADEQWQEFEAWGVKGNRAKLLAIMYFLHLLAPHLAYVILPRARIAEWLGLSDKTTGRLIREMDERGLIRINRNVDGSGRNWSYTAKQAREAALVGLGEEVAREVAASGECVLDAWEQIFETEPPSFENLPESAEPALRAPPDIPFGRPPPERPFDPAWDLKPADPRDQELVLAAAKARGIVPRWAAAA
jgi:DNA-binding MarR family transcriptional regulator